MVRAYKFISNEYGLNALRDKRLKISRIHTLNDPYDVLPFGKADSGTRRALEAVRDELDSRFGLICFSSTWDSPLLWAHYAENHNGFALGFDLPEESAADVSYVSAPLPFPSSPDEETARQLLFTKYSDWQYENEVRAWVRLEEKVGDLYFKPFDYTLQLREIVIGWRSTTTRQLVLDLLGSGDWSELRIVKAERSYTEFAMVESMGAEP